MGSSGKWSSSVLQSVGREALSLAEEFKSQLEPRLGAGVLDGLKCDLDAFDGKRSDASNALGTLKLATRQQEEAIAHAIAFLSAARQAVVRAGASVAQRTAFGTTKKYKANNVSSVVGALDAFLVGAEKFTDFVRAAGVLPSDLDTAKALRTALIGADQSQEAQKSKRKEPTLQRNAAQLRIESAITAIINAGRLAFLTKPDVAARFKALAPSSGSSSKKTGSPVSP